jgi:hypothetical protein
VLTSRASTWDLGIPLCATGPFPDVATDHPFCPEITWMKDNNISIGFADGTYRPAATLTRQAMADSTDRQRLIAEGVIETGNRMPRLDERGSHARGRPR